MRARTYTTDPPRYRPYTEWTWTWCWELHAPEPMQKVELLFRGAAVTWSKRPRREAALNATHGLSVSPRDPKRADDTALLVAVPLGQVAVADRALKAAPERVLDSDLVVRHLTCDATVHTGELIDVVSLIDANGDVRRSSVFLVAASDTANARNGRWRVRPRLAGALPSALSVLRNGRRWGTTPVESGPLLR